MSPAPGPTDIREMFGFDKPLSRAVGGAVVAMMTYGATQNLGGVSPLWPVPVVIVIMAAATLTLMMAPGDPVGIGAALFVALAVPVASVILLPAVPVPLENVNQVWVAGYATLLHGFLCLRGRASLAWLSAALTIGVYGTWSVETGQGAMEGAGIPLFNLGALLGITVTCIAIRPTFRAILALRTQSLQRVAIASAATAAQQERNERLAELDEKARPLLARIATGVPLSPTERQRCELLEAQLRDQLRAAALVTPETAAAAQEARVRGVEVMMIDDGGLEGATERIRDSIHAAVADALREAVDGDVRVRVSPPGRPNLVSIYRRARSGTTRIDIDKDGRISKGARAQHVSPDAPHP